MKVSFSIADLFQKEFGYVPDSFIPQDKDNKAFRFTSTNTEYGDRKGVHNADASKAGVPLYSKDAWGRDFFMPVWLTVPNQNLPFSNNTIPPSIQGQTIELPYPVMRIESSKRIVETPLTERQDTAKELINIEGYHITIRGIMIDPDGNWPEDLYVTLNNLHRVQASLTIKSALTHIFLVTPDRLSSDQVVIKSLRFPEGKGGPSVRLYEMELLSDAPFSLEEI